MNISQTKSKTSDDIQIHLVQWLGDLVKSHLGDNSCPSVLLNHFVGTDRALGAYFCRFFANRNELTSDEYMQIARLMASCRSLIVVDDAMRDKDITGLSQDELILLRHVFYSKCEELLSQFTGDHESAHLLMQARDQQLEDAYSSIQNGEPPSFDMVGGKCAFLEIPFDALKTKVDKTIVDQLRNQAFAMLCILQIADDYADRLSDQEKPYFSNLISWGSDFSPVAKRLQDDAELSVKYASLIIYILLNKLADISKDNIHVISWVEEAKRTLSWNGTDYIDNFTEQAFSYLLNGEYKVPATNEFMNEDLLNRLDVFPKVQFELSAELLHMTVTKKVVS